MNARFWSCALAAILVYAAAAQTMIDLRTQSKGVDHSGARSTKPFKSGVNLPPTCSTGEFFYWEAVQPGKNLYACTGTNIWTLYGGTQLPQASGAGILSSDGASIYWTALTGDVSGDAERTQVSGIQGRTVAPTTPANGQVLVWNESSARWEPGNSTGLFSDMSDVKIEGPWSGHFLYFDANDWRWKNRGVVGGSSGAIEVNTAIDPVEVELNIPVTRQYLSSEIPAPNAIPRADASGKLAAEWISAAAALSHASSHQNGGLDEVATTAPAAHAIPKADASGKLGTGWIPAMPALSHAASHQNGGLDEIATTTPAANAIPKADGSGKLAAGWLPTSAGTTIDMTATSAIPYFLFGLPQAPFASGTAFSNTRPRYFPFHLPFAISYQTLAISSSVSSGDTSKYVAVAIADKDCNVISGTRANASGFASSTRRPLIASAPVTLPPGLYYFAIATEDTSVQFMSSNGGAYHYVNSAAGPRVFTGSNNATGAGATLAIPDSCGGRTPWAGNVTNVAVVSE